MNTARTDWQNAVVRLNAATALLREFLDESVADDELREAAETVSQDPNGDGDA